MLTHVEGLIAEEASAAYSFSAEKVEEDKWIRLYCFPLTPSERTAARGEIITETKLVKDHLKEFHATIMQEVEVPLKEQEPNPVRQLVKATQLEVVVGFDEEADLLIDRLTRGPKYLDIVSIVGMLCLDILNQVKCSNQ
ncbi:hypothetical protein BC332_14793 [Capsicum chinense]|nr:hypothetical protein BC332_14793 [Capsicum chinense]